MANDSNGIEILKRALREAQCGIRRINRKVSAAALDAEEVERVITPICSALRLHERQRSKRRSDLRTALALSPRVANSQTRLREAAKRSPIVTLEWRSPVGRRTTGVIDGTSVTLSNRLATILRILGDQPPGSDGLARFISYPDLLAQVSEREGRKVSRHALSQSLSLLASAFDQHRLNYYLIERDAKHFRVRLLYRQGLAAIAPRADVQADPGQ